jgi:hypothetical protein
MENLALEYKGFLSYVRIADEQDQGKILDLCASVERELRIKSIKFKFLNDKADIQWGDHWRAFVDATPASCNILCPILVESYFDSDNCTREYFSFLKSEKDNSKKKAIIPIYYDECIPPKQNSHLIGDEIKKDALERQYLDWTKLRHEPIGSRARNIAISEAGERIARMIRRWEEADLRNSRPGVIEIDSFEEMEERLSPINTARVLTWLSDTKDEGSKRIILKLLDQPNTQQRIIKFIYTRIRSDESAIVDDVYKRCLITGVINGECTASEFMYRIRDLYHSGLVNIKLVGTQTTVISQSPNVRQAIALSGISSS